MKILILEAEEKDQVITEALISDKTATMIILFNPDDVPKILENESFDIIFIPLKINGVDSFKLCRRIKIFHPGCNIYAYSQHLQIFDTDVLEHGAGDVYKNHPPESESLWTILEGAAHRPHAIEEMHRLAFSG